nr:reverse transcriptase domain-containing protein [Tanacetum cinerariifolium]
MEVLYELCFNWLWPEIKSQMVSMTTSLTGFSGETIWPLGQLRLLVSIGGAEHYTKAWMNFMIVKSPSPYNGIIERPGIREIQAVQSTAHEMLKFPANGIIVTIRITILTPTECATVAATPKDSAKKAEARHKNFKVAIHPDFPDQEITIRGTNIDSISEKDIPLSDRKKGAGPEARQGNLSKDLNKACPQVCYPLPEIDWKVESICGYPFKCFLDAYKGYHQIQMAEQDEEKTAFHTSHGVFCYTKMPFGLKNAGATYQRLVDKAFDKKNGYMISPEGVKPCPDKTEAVLQLPSPQTIKEVQSLNGKLASLKRFLSKLAKKSLPLFKTLKKCIKKSDFHWTPEAEQAFKQLKRHLANLPMLVAPKPKEDLIIYLFASYGAISVVLMTEKDTVQTPVYFVSRALQAPKLNYTQMEKLVMALVSATKRLRRYVQAHPIVVITDQPIKQVISRAGLILTSPEGTYVSKEENMIKYLEKTKSLISGFANFSISQVPRGKNKKSDALSKIVSTSFAHLSKQVLVEVLKEKSIQEREMATVVEEEGPTWMTPIIEYLRDGSLPDNQKEASKLHIKARQYELLEGILYRRSQGHAVRVLLANHASGRPGKVKFLIVAMDYFTKWIEANAVATISSCQVKKFVWDNIRFASVKHLQSNGLVERENRSLGEGIKSRLGEGNKNWLEELPHVLWAHRTMIKSSNDTSFSLTYGTEAVIPTEIGTPTYRTMVVDAMHNDEELRLNLDLLEERHERAAIHEAKAKLKMTNYYNARVRGVTFRPGDFVYRSNDASHAVDGEKLGPKWEGPYEVTEALGDGAYKLRSTDKTVLPRT